MDLLLLAGIALLVALAFFQLFSSTKRGAEISNAASQIAQLNSLLERLERAVKDEITNFRTEVSQNARQDRTESAASFKTFNDSMLQAVNQMGLSHKEDANNLIGQVGKLTEAVETRLEAVRKMVEDKLNFIQEDNSKKLEQIRTTVDEKLQGTLEKRLGESFKQVSERLEQVHKGLGEMQTLANGVGDLKRVLTNVKTRGGWGEMQLASLLEQMLTPEQYEANVKTHHESNDLVEFAIKLPGRKEGEKSCIWLPVDSKFPIEDYQRLVDAQEKANPELAAQAAAALETRIKNSAKDISSKYIDPPNTTDFAVMFLPLEGLYAEVLRRTGLVEHIQREYRVTVSGPATFAALLNSLQMGFRTLAIEKRSAEVWTLLGAVKTQFGRFGEMLDKVRKNIEQAGKSIDSAAQKSRFIEKKLRKVEELPADEAKLLIEDGTSFDTEDGEDFEGPTQ